MTNLAIMAGALLAMRLLRYVKAGAVAFAAPALLLTWFAWTRTTLSILAVWLVCGITLAVLWREDRG